MLNARVAAAAPFAVVGTAAIIAAGGIAAAIAWHPTEHLVWMVAYLVLVAGVMQWVFGVGAAWLAADPPGRGAMWATWGLFNVGNAGVIGGTLCSHTGVVAIATVLFVLALAGFLSTVRRSRHHGWAVAYRVAVVLILLSAATGLVLSALSNRLI